jgi:hypothetical protein
MPLTVRKMISLSKKSTVVVIKKGVELLPFTKALAIDFGGTHATCGLVEDRVLLAHETIDTNSAKSIEAVLPRIRDTCRGLMHGRGLSPVTLRA